jgi:hypothetical protein
MELPNPYAPSAHPRQSAGQANGALALAALSLFSICLTAAMIAAFFWALGNSPAFGRRLGGPSPEELEWVM